MKLSLRQQVIVLPSLLLALYLPLHAHGQRYLLTDPDTGDIVNENVVMADRSGEIEDLKVTLKVEAGILELVTEDRVPWATLPLFAGKGAR